MHTIPKSSVVFYATAFVLAIALAASGLLTEASPYMLTPAVAVLVALIATGEIRRREAWADLGLHRFGLAYWPIAIAVPFIIVGLGFGIAWVTGEAKLAAPETIFGMSLDSLIWAIPLAFVLNTVTWSLAEEVGWRGYLQPRLASFGALRASLITGFLWGVWHVPLIVLTSLYHPGVDLTDFLPLFIAMATAAGLFFGWLRIATGSVWPASIAHTAHNIAVALFMAFTVDPSADAKTLSGEAGVITILGYAIVGALLFVRRRPRVATTPSSRPIRIG